MARFTEQLESRANYGDASPVLLDYFTAVCDDCGGKTSIPIESGGHICGGYIVECLNLVGFRVAPDPQGRLLDFCRDCAIKRQRATGSGVR